MPATIKSHLRTLSEEKVMSTSNFFEIIFPEKKTRIAAEQFSQSLAKNSGIATKNLVSEFANSLHNGIILDNGNFYKYSRRNLYMTVIRTLLDMGFIQRNVPIWDISRKKTLYVYSRNLLDIPNKPPSVGFWKIAYYICRKWNNIFIN